MLLKYSVCKKKEKKENIYMCVGGNHDLGLCRDNSVVTQTEILFKK